MAVRVGIQPSTIITFLITSQYLSHTMLTISDHRRDSAGMTYVYPVVSRRAGGVSVGINLNTNNACNWACLYCQVPELKRGGPPPIDLDRLEMELRRFLREAVHGDYLVRNAPPEARRLVDVAFSGNGEPTSADEFADAVLRLERVLQDLSLLGVLKVRLITNGSLMHRENVQLGLARIARLGGEVWFKLDRATAAGVRRINSVGHFSSARLCATVRQCAQLVPIWIQTCWFALDGEAPSALEQDAYLACLDLLRPYIQGVLLYGPARPSLQPESFRISAVPPEIMQGVADRIEALGVKVIMTP